MVAARSAAVQDVLGRELDIGQLRGVTGHNAITEHHIGRHGRAVLRGRVPEGSLVDPGKLGAGEIAGIGRQLVAVKPDILDDAAPDKRVRRADQRCHRC